MREVRRKLTIRALGAIQQRSGTVRRLASRLEVTERELRPVLRVLVKQKRIGCDCGKYYHRRTG